MINKFNPKKIKYLKIINKALSVVYHEEKSTTIPDIASANSILIIDPTLIGDIVMLVPLLRIIKKNNDHCTITLACGKWAKAVLQYEQLVDEYIFIDSSFLNSVRQLALNRKKLREQVKLINYKQYDYALEPRGDLRYIYFMHYCNAKRKISYNYTGGEPFLTDVINPSEKITHLVEDKLYFAKRLGCKYDENLDIYPRLKISESQQIIRSKFLEDHNLNDYFVIGIHPGASLEKKRWDDYDKIIPLILNRINKAFFLIFQGPGEEKDVIPVANAAEKYGANYLVSDTSIEEYMLRISICNLLVCNDSGAGHIAAAYHVPVFVLFGPFYPEMVKPYLDQNVFCFSERVECKPCMSKMCENNKACLRQIKPETVANSIMDFYASNN